ncbi:MAG TPA: crosslink repair DNA glycosylase YcaQ family protein [Vicinamibacterales bacterium]|nr:crosslink repair DNA glycosylase YcaQ family protein [Vicinamibacterales bacterium]
MKTVADLRRFAVSRSLFPPTTLPRAMERMAFVQADPIRAPARAQDLTLRPRVRGYRAGHLDAAYGRLPIEEDFFINYGFVTRTLQALMHPRSSVTPSASNKRARAILEFVRERGSVHPREVDAHFDHGVVTNFWGGSSSATTHLMELMHYKGLLRVVRRENGIRIYAAQQHGDAPSGAAERRRRIDALVDAAIDLYAPVPAASMSFIIRRLRYAAPHWQGEIAAALQRARTRLAHAVVDGQTWYWPAADNTAPADVDGVRLLAPFDPVVWDRTRFELLWGWAYRFEAYTPVTKRKLGYYALPMLWRDRVIGWANVTRQGDNVVVDVGYVAGRPPRDREFKTSLEHDVEDLRRFLK